MKTPGKANPGETRPGEIKPDDVKKIAVIGAGLMGHGIALEFAAYGRSVSIHDKSEELLGEAIAARSRGAGRPGQGGPNFRRRC